MAWRVMPVRTRLVFGCSYQGSRMRGSVQVEPGA